MSVRESFGINGGWDGLYSLAHVTRSPDVGRMSREDVTSMKLPKDISMNLDRLERLKRRV